MYVKHIIVFLAAIFGISECFGNEIVSKAARHGSFNAYYLYTRNNPREPTRILPQASGLPANNVFKSQTAIVVHGLQASASTSLNPVVKDAFISSLDMNVIVVDWSTPAAVSVTAEQAVPSVGRALADFIQILVQNNRIALDRLHLVGYGLGAHVVGFAGRTFNGRVARITGLAPPTSPYSLQATDARYVEVIHEDDDEGSGENAIVPIGHVDFIPNGGHLAWELFAASLTHNQLIGYLCRDISSDECNGYTLPVGNNDHVKYGSGIFRVNTKPTYPYA